MTDPVPSKERVESALFWAGVAGHGDGYVLAQEVERLRTALRGIQSCSTCEVCRGVATRVLTPPPEVGFDANGSPVTE